MTEELSDQEYRALFDRVNAAAGGLIYNPKTGLLDWNRINIALDKGLEEELCLICADDQGQSYIRAFSNLKKHGCIDNNGNADGVHALKDGLEKELSLLYSKEALDAWKSALNN